MTLSHRQRRNVAVAVAILTAALAPVAYWSTPALQPEPRTIEAALSVSFGSASVAHVGLAAWAERVTR